MKNITLLIFLSCVLLQTNAQQSKWNRTAQLKSCKVFIKADNFTANTFLEMEFYNPNDTEIEGLYQFALNPGQAITGFQLMLNNTYRDGSIEEKCKATDTYNTIVDKHVDPGLLTLLSDNQYRLNVYPIQPKSSRKITISITEILPVVDNELRYSLPFNMTDSCENFSIDIDVKQPGTTDIKTSGLIKWLHFLKLSSRQELKYRLGSLLLNTPLSFSIPLTQTNIVGCTDSSSKKYFALRHKTFVLSTYDPNVSTLTVFWDVSASSLHRNLKKEINFLEQLLGFHQVKKLIVVPFNTKIQGRSTFIITNNNYDWKNYINHLQYSGATQFGCIDLTKDTSGMVMIFSDGKNTYGRRTPLLGDVLVYCVNSAGSYNDAVIQKRILLNGGKIINLLSATIYDALFATSKANNWLLGFKSASGHASIDQTTPADFKTDMVVSGFTDRQKDTLYLSFGNCNKIKQIDTVVLDFSHCDQLLNNRMNMLDKFSKLSNGIYWEDILEFGLREHVVTSNTALIVLEKASDYVKYNIEPPKDLEQACNDMNYVKRDARWERNRFIKTSAYDRLGTIISAYNEDNRKRNPKAILLTLDKSAFTRSAAMLRENNEAPATLQQQLIGRVSGVQVVGEGKRSLQDVVFIGYGNPISKSSLTGAVASIRSNQLLPFGTIEQSIQSRTSGLQVTSAYSGGLPSMANVKIRGASSLSGNDQPLFVLDGMPVNDDINQLVNISEINDVTVLKDASATALYGNRGANGVIVVNRKKPAVSIYPDYNSKYKLSEGEDVDYLAEWYAADARQKMAVYKFHLASHKTEPGFYFDMAQAFYKIGNDAMAMNILMEANEVSNGVLSSKIASAYILESWNKFDEAAFIYEQLVDDYPQWLPARRNLAWAFYRQGKYQLSVNTFFDALQSDFGSREASALSMKVAMLKEMNAIISIHKQQLDVTAIPKGMIQPVSADLRIVLDCNNDYLSGVTIKKSGAHKVRCDTDETVFSSDYYNRDYAEYQSDVAKPGHYKINMMYHDYNSGYYKPNPCYVRIMVFKNFGKENQSIAIENVVLDNQFGDIEISDLQVD